MKKLISASAFLIFSMACPFLSWAAEPAKIKNICEESLSIRGEINTFFDLNGGQYNNSNQSLMAPILTKEKLVKLLQDIIRDPEALEEIGRRSYTHSLGFRKITLMHDWDSQPDGRPGRGWDLRLHIWWPQKAKAEGIALAEGKHEHRWHFGSRIISGIMENHRYRIRPLTETEHAIYQKFEKAMTQMTPAKVLEIADRLDALEIFNMAETATKMLELSGGLRALEAVVNEAELSQNLDLNHNELLALMNMYTKNGNQLDLTTNREEYRSLGARYLEFKDVEIHRSGDYYYHPVEYAHRLFIDPSIFTSTFLVTGPEIPGQVPGELVHSNAAKDAIDSRPRRPYTAAEMRQEFIDYLEAIGASYQN